jgi:hypothetical protein
MGVAEAAGQFADSVVSVRFGPNFNAGFGPDNPHFQDACWADQIPQQDLACLQVDSRGSPSRWAMAEKLLCIFVAQSSIVRDRTLSSLKMRSTSAAIPTEHLWKQVL